MSDIKRYLLEYEQAVTALQKISSITPEFNRLEQKIADILQLMENNVTDEDIPLLIKPLAFVGGPVIPPAAVRTVASIGSGKAFDAIFQILKECFEDGRSEDATANECVKALDDIDAERAEREGVQDIIESGWF